MSRMTKKPRKSSAFARLGRRPARDWLLLIEAVLTLSCASLAIRVLPFRRITKLISSPPRHPPEGHLRLETTISSSIWAVEAAARRLPFKTVCFQKGLAIFWILNRRSIPARLHYGVAQNPDKGLRAHVWVSCEGRNIMGGESAADFACLATYPSADGRARSYGSSSWS